MDASTVQTEVKRKLAKSLILNEKLKSKYEFEREVSKELAVRNDNLKKDIGAEYERYKELKSDYEMLTNQINKLIATIVISNASAQTSAIIEELGSLMDAQHEKYYPKPISVPASAIVSLDDKKVIDMNPTTSSSIALDYPSSTSVDISPNVTASPADTTAAPPAKQHKSRRRASSVYILEGTGTSLTRHTSLGVGTATVSATHASLEMSEGSPVHSGVSTTTPKTIPSVSNLFGSAVNAEEPESMTESMETQSESKQPLVSEANTIAGTIATAPVEAVPLFEHFLVVGMPQSAADEFAQHIRVAEEKSITNTIMKRFGGLFNSPSTRDVNKPNTGRTSLEKGFSSSSVVSDAATSGGDGHATSTSSTMASARKMFSFFNKSNGSSIAEEPVSQPPVVEAADEEAPETNNGNNFATPMKGENSASVLEPAPAAEVATEIEPEIEPASSQLRKHDTSKGTASTDASILFRYPPDVDPPPPEVCEFCLPLGGKLERIAKKEEDTIIQEILYGHGQSKRSSKCFVFMLEDKTTQSEHEGDDEKGTNTGRLYGVCVIHPRLLKGRSKKSTPHVGLAGSPMKENGRDTNMEEVIVYEFEAQVCYAFITRYPLFDFFFQTIWDLITWERLHRMEAVAMHMSEPGETDDAGPVDEQGKPILHYDRFIYQYLPTMQYTDVLSRLSQLSSPRYGDCLKFHACRSLNEITFHRKLPPYDIAEHAVNASSWALPTLLSWVPVELLIWTISLMMCEAKVLVVGVEPGLVSCGVMSLLSLMRPLSWVAPVIPVLPIKHLDFIESPVPIVAGLVLDPADKGLNPMKIMELCEDGETMAAVFDVSNRAVYVSKSNLESLRDFVMPGGDLLCDKLNDCIYGGFGHIEVHPGGSGLLSNVTASTLGNNIKAVKLGNSDSQTPLMAQQQTQQRILSKQQRSRPLYDVSEVQKSVTKDVQQYILGHVMTVIAKTKEHLQNISKLKEDRVNGVLTDDDDRVLFGDDLKVTAVNRKENSEVVATPANCTPFSNSEQTTTDVTAELDSNANTVSIDENANTSNKEDSFFNFDFDDNQKTTCIDLLKLPLVGNDAQFYRKFSQTQIFSEYTMYVEGDGI